jgi:transposase
MSVMEREPVRTRRSFTDEFKRDAVALVIDEGRRVIDVAGALGVGEGTLGNWVRQARVDRGERAGEMLHARLRHGSSQRGHKRFLGELIARVAGPRRTRVPDRNGWMEEGECR